MSAKVKLMVTGICSFITHSFINFMIFILFKARLFVKSTDELVPGILINTGIITENKFSFLKVRSDSKLHITSR